ncbi:MAG: SpoIIE family protein phosphatase, partial [Leptospiraceae bacterium]|nr:SpoIIE family protein phosphatase [Leptospiraceae bacterium]
MAKLVGISLVTVLLVIGYISNITLTLSEKDYDNQKVAILNANKEFILKKEFSKLPEDVLYVIRKEKDADIFERNLELLFTRDKNVLNSGILNETESKFREQLLKETKAKLKKNFPELSPSEQYTESIELFRASRQYFNLQKLLEKEKVRNYRDAGLHYTSFDFIHEKHRYEIGFSYQTYRKHVHETGWKLFILSLLVPVIILVVFPKFFQSSLVKPLQNLLKGMHRVNLGDLQVNVPIKIQDEIGFITNTFNNMVLSIREARMELKEYANTLEEKVIERTRELKARMKEIEDLKIQQDGDYFLTSLLTKPLSFNANDSEVVATNFIIRQKKKFEFRNKKSELGGDICVTSKLQLGKPNKLRNYIVILNGDAMGKSMQGAGGAIVMGVVIQSILSRYKTSEKLKDISPERWIEETYHECNSVFKSFQGTMVISAILGIVDELNGEMWDWNAEHPFPILYRDNKAEFIEDSISVRKLGLEENVVVIKKFQLLAGDTLILGSDGKDDIDLTPDEEIRTINEDETLFLKIVEQANADLEKIVELLCYNGEITDDLSILKLDFHHVSGSLIEQKSEPEITFHTEEMVSLPEEHVLQPSYYEHSRDLYLKGRVQESLNVLKKGFHVNNSDPRLCKLLGLVAFKEKDYEYAMLG